MKKFYSTVLACALAFTAFAQAPVSTKVEKVFTNEITSGIEVKKADLSKTLSTPSKLPFKAPYDLTVDHALVAGKSFFHGNLTNKTNNEDYGYITNIEITAPDAEGNVLIKNLLSDFFDIPTNDLQATIYNEVVGASETSEGVEATFLEIGLNQDLFTYDGNTMKVYFYFKYSDGRYYIDDTANLTFLVYSDGSLGSAYQDEIDMGIFVGFETASGFSGYTPWKGVLIVKPNATMTAERVLDINEDNQAQVESVTYDVYAEYNDEYKAVVLLNFLESYEFVPFFVDAEAGDALAIDAVAGAVSLSQPVGEFPAGVYNYYFYNGETEEHIIAEATYTTDETTGNAVLASPEMLLMSDLGWVEYFLDIELKLPFNVNGEVSGIKEVIATEDNSNAPVEYYNLQGIRVENPAAGIYVRRQGSNVTKVLVK